MQNRSECFVAVRGLVALACIGFIAGGTVAEAQLRDVNGEVIPGTDGLRLRPGADLSNLNLPGLRVDSNATGNLKLQDVNFENSNLSGARLSGLFFFSSGFETDLLSAANFSNTDISNAALVTNAITEEQLYSTSNYQSKDLSNIRFENQSFFFTTIKFDVAGWNFREQNMSHVVMSGTEAQNTDFSSATLAGANLARSNFGGASFRTADLSSADLFDAQINQSDFSHANLMGADFRGTDVTETEFPSVQLHNASFRFAQGLTAEKFTGNVTYNQWTEFPTGFDPSEAGLTRIDSPVGDFNADQVVDTRDANILATRLRNGTDVDYFTVTPFRKGWVIRDSRYSDFVYALGDVDPGIIFAELNVKGVHTVGDADVDYFLAQQRNLYYENAEWLEPMFDLNGDGQVRSNDLDVLMQDLLDVPPSGDFNQDGVWNGEDIDMLMLGIWERNTDRRDFSFDLNRDGRLNNDDRDAWLAEAGPKNGFAEVFLLGDVNLDGQVNSADLGELGLRWQSDSTVAWTEGNLSGRGVDAEDLTLLAVNWQESIPTSAAAAAVPEPSTLTTFWLAMLLLGVTRRRVP